MLPRIGFIGCGAFSTSCLYPSLRLLAFGLEPYGSEPDVELVACCDMDGRLAERNARAFGFRRAYTNYREMLEREELDTVFVVMHPQLQPSLAIEVMESGRNVYVEKPPARTLGEVRAMQQASRRTGRFCQIGFMKRFSEPYVLARGIASRPEFGQPSVYESRKARNAPYPPVYDYLNDFVCHHLDLARYFMGDVEYVYAELISRTHDPDDLNARLFERADVYRNWASVLREMPHVPQSDGYLIMFRFASGAIGVHNANTLETDTNLLERVTLTGEGAVVAVEDWYRVRAAIKDEPPYTWEPLVIDKSVNGRLLHTGYFGEVRELVAATREGRAPNAATVDDGVACLELVAAVRASIAQGRRVALSEVRAAEPVV
ncbi:MAG: Gfo/Idh/MocA family oxidoreductase [Chloroflexota bacterium]|nr:Gfo/Idh/MocA family oxidoreductase [Chloroflexota bacterium]